MSKPRARPTDESKPRVKTKDVRAPYDRAPQKVSTLEQEYAELRTRTPGGRG